MMNDKAMYVKPEIEVIEVVMEEVIAGLGSSSVGSDDMDLLPSEPSNGSSSNPFGSFPSYRD